MAVGAYIVFNIIDHPLCTDVAKMRLRVIEFDVTLKTPPFYVHQCSRRFVLLLFLDFSRLTNVSFFAILNAEISGLVIAMEFPLKCRAAHLRHGHQRHRFLVTVMTVT